MTSSKKRINESIFTAMHSGLIILCHTGEDKGGILGPKKAEGSQ